MTRFLDGPARGKTLTLKRCPLFLRVTIEQRTGKVDALDLLDDVPTPQETVHVYKKVSDDGTAFVDGRDPKTGKRWGFCERMATYAIVEVQPPDSTMRDTRLWREWIAAEASKILERPIEVDDEGMEK